MNKDEIYHELIGAGCTHTEAVLCIAKEYVNRDNAQKETDVRDILSFLD